MAEASNRAIYIQDSLSGERKQLKAAAAGELGIYACGPTVYSRIHIGNARPFVVFSLLKRFLQHEGYKVKFVVNVTDVNDKIYTAAQQAGIGSDELAKQMTAQYVADTDGLDLGRPDHEPLATETITEIIELIEALIEREHAYESGGDVYFRVSSYNDYGELSHRDPETMDQGEEAGSESLKESALDFALWKTHKPGEDTSWESPWGRGRPGWHIECSAMAESLLGVDFDIHGGGSDLTFPHHENEAAQTKAARGRPLAKVWMHNGMVRLQGEKMAKSVGNIRTLHDVLEDAGRDAVIIYFLSGHYRQPILFSGERLAESQAQIERIREALRSTVAGETPDALKPLKEQFFDALAEDFNTPKALATLFDWIREANRSGTPVGNADLVEMLTVFALENLVKEADGCQAPPELVALLEDRQRARAERDFAAADAIRDRLAAEGWQVRDSANGPELIPIQ